MHFSYGHTVSRFLLLLTLLLATPLNAAQQVEFKVKPITCIVLNSGDSCSLLAHFSWQLNQENDVCLWQEQQLLQCWKKSQKDQQSLAITINKTTLFYLKNKHGDLFAQQSINLNSQTHKRYRRRLHSDWSLF